MVVRLTDPIARSLPAPERGSRVHYDSETRGLGVRVTMGGARSWVLNYSFHGTERRMILGRVENWPIRSVRERIKELRREKIDRGIDPLAERMAERKAPTIDDLAERFVAEYLPGKKAGTREGYEGAINKHIRLALGKVKVAELKRSDVERMHRRITDGNDKVPGAPIAANRAVAVLSSMLSRAVKDGLRSDNPCKGVERTAEVPRERYLTPDEIARLFAAIDDYAVREPTSANAIRLMAFTGARKGETLAARWSDFDLVAGVWTKPAHSTKQGRTHRVPLSAEALTLLRGMPRDSEFLFPSRGSHLADVRYAWNTICERAGIEGAHAHDLRHTYASILVSKGLSLPIIGKLLGHSNIATTERYSHLFEESLREATEMAGAAIAANVVKLRRTG